MNEDCFVCITPLSNTNEFGSPIIFQCGHSVHKVCLDDLYKKIPNPKCFCNHPIKITSNKPHTRNIIFNEYDEYIIDLILNKRKNVFLHGPGGVGKSTLLEEIIKRAERRNLNIYPTATTGIASINLEGGMTIHKYSGIGKGDEDEEILYKRVRVNSKAVVRWRSTSILIIDEISMMGASLFEKLNNIAQKVRNSRFPFGNIQLLICGDLLQLPPVNDDWIFNSKAFKEQEFQIINLTTPRRYTDNTFFELLLRIRRGEPTFDDIKVLRSREEANRELDFNTLQIKPTILYSKKIEVDFYNLTELNKLSGEEFTYNSIDSFEFKNLSDDNDKSRLYYKNLLSDAIPEKIKLKVGAQVMLKHNLDIESGLANGSRGVVMGIDKVSRIVQVKFLNGSIVNIDVNIWEVKNKEVYCYREQIPLILAWASTIHKCQGSTLDLVICDIGHTIFTYAQAYVALSRVRNLEGLYISEFEERSIRADPIALKFLKDQEDKKNIDIEFKD